MDAHVDPMRFSVELDPGVQPSFTPIVRLSAAGQQLFVTAMVDRRDVLDDETAGGVARARIAVVLNWFEELRAKVPR